MAASSTPLPRSTGRRAAALGPACPVVRREEDRMRFRCHRLSVLATATAVAATGAALGAFTPAESAVPTITVTPWLTGLNAPRGVAFDGNGHFYVAESGTAGSGDHGLTRTGRVKRFTV